MLTEGPGSEGWPSLCAHTHLGSLRDLLHHQGAVLEPGGSAETQESWTRPTSVDLYGQEPSLSR